MATNQPPPRGYNVVFTILVLCLLIGFVMGLTLGFTLGDSAASCPKAGDWEVECINDSTFPGVRCYGYCGPETTKEVAEEPR